MILEVTQHAVERFWARVIPPAPIGVDFDEEQQLERTESAGRMRIEEAFARAARLKHKTRAGEEQYKCEDPRMILVVKRDPGATVVVTVLGPNDAPWLFGGVVHRPEEEVEDEPPAPSWEHEAELVLRVRWELKSGDREAVEREVLGFVSNVARRANGGSTGRGLVVSVRRKPT